MKRFVIEGGKRLEGTTYVSGSKNACLAVLAGSILCDKPITFIDVPDIKDVGTMNSLLLDLGGQITLDATRFEELGVNTSVWNIDNSNINKQIAEYDKQQEGKN